METDDSDEFSTQLKQNLPRYQAPPGLESRIRRTIAEQARNAALPSGAPVAETMGERLARWWQQWAGIGIGFACGALLTVAVVHYRGAGFNQDAFEQQLVASHVRSLMVGHLTDVLSSDQHTVKPWFTGKLDYAPPVIDLQEKGFPLIGGRLDYLDGRAVAALVYRHQQHTINVFVRPARDDTHKVTLVAKQGFNLASWNQSDMQFWAVSDVNADELQKFSSAFQARVAE